jgi:hypothetical protein
LGLRKPNEGTDPRERRRKDRFPTESNVRYTLLVRGSRGKTGTGRAIDISSHGIRFRTEEPLTPGSPLLLSVDWPVRLGEACLLQLVARARVVRCGGGVAAARFESWEFHTRRSQNVDERSRLPSVSNIE